MVPNLISQNIVMTHFYIWHPQPGEGGGLQSEMSFPTALDWGLVEDGDHITSLDPQPTAQSWNPGDI
jgi:hypothetical protein